MAGAQQQALITLTDEEVQTRAKILARLLHELDELQQEHKDAKDDMKAAEKHLNARIRRIAKAIREGSVAPGEEEAL